MSLLIITEAKLEKLKKEIKKICHEDEDSVMIYKFDSLKYSTKEAIGLIMTNDNSLKKSVDIKGLQ